jgi:hypothetical protein
MSRPVSLLDFALAYARAGFAVFPCRRRGKEPITKHGFKDASCDEAQIRKWWMDSPNANVGIASGARSGLIVVDIDSLAGAKLLAELARQFGTLPPTHHDTTGKGHQFFFKLRSDCGTVPSSAEGGLDIRADGGYVVAPPSIHPNGKTYQWDATSPDEIAFAPQWLLGFARNREGMLKALGRAEAGGDRAGAKIAGGGSLASAGPANGPSPAFAVVSPPDMKRGYPDGQRTSELTKRVGWCLGPGGKMTDPEALAACLAWNELNTPPLPEEKVRTTVASIARKEARKIASGRARPSIKVVGGDLAREADEAEQALIGAGLPIFIRAGALVTPVLEEAPAAKDRTTIVARLRKLTVDGIIDWLSRYADFQRFDARAKKWVSIDPAERVAKIILSRAGVGKFPQVAGVITTPTLRPDGSILTEPGYDPSTRLYLALDDNLAMPAMPVAPSRADALEALSLLRDLLSGFPFVSPVDRAVALSGIMTAVLRGAVSVAPMHGFRAHTAGTGKSLLVDVAATIATGRLCPVIAAGKTEEETEKRLGALLRDGVPVVSLDNVSGELGGDALAQMTERPLVRVRILGKSEAPEFECKAAVFATGNNLVLVGDMVRRAVVCTLDARVERPELREFNFDPIDRVLQNRGAYVAACLTIARAYRVAGAPKACRPLGSYGDWSDMVRAPLIWLGEADPVASMETAREEDPELAAIRELFAQLPHHFGEREWTTAELIKIACERSYGREFIRPELRELLLRVAGEGGAVSGKRLGKFLSKIGGRVVGGFRLEKKRDPSHGNRFSLRPAPPQGGAYADGGLGAFGG